MILNVILDLPDDGTFLRVARRIGRTLLEDLGVIEPDIADIEFVVGELSSNVIRHAQSSSGRFTVDMKYHADKVVITVKDTGTGFCFKDVPPAGSERPDIDGGMRLGGFGLGLVRQLADHLAFTRAGNDGTTVQAEKLLHYNTRAEAQEAAALDREGGGEMTITTA